jgi:hypothetical protein
MEEFYKILQNVLIKDSYIRILEEGRGEAENVCYR